MKQRKQGGKAWLVRVDKPVTLAEAGERLDAFRKKNGAGPHRAATLASEIWPDAKFRTNQGAGAAASRVLKRLNKTWGSNDHNWGWYL